MDLQPLFRLLHACAMLWHVLAFGAGAVFVYFSYRALFGVETYESRWGKIIRGADVHLWLSGFVIIGLGAAMAGIEPYFSNPKLWCKVVVIVLWFIVTQLMRYIAIPQLRQGKRELMLATSAISLSCWIYGAFLGGARAMAGGVVPFSHFLGGFALTILACVGTTFYLEKHFPRPAR